MKRWRIAMVVILAAVIVLGHAIDIVAMREDWPFSFYYMYARAEKKTRLDLLSLFGLMREPGRRALVRITDPKYVPPLGEARLRVILMAAYRNGQTPQNLANAKQVLADYLRLYESRRIAGLHDGPRMIEAHLYRLAWKLRPDGTPESRPAKSIPLLKVTWEEVQPPSTPLVEQPPVLEEES